MFLFVSPYVKIRKHIFFYLFYIMLISAKWCKSTKTWNKDNKKYVYMYQTVSNTRKIMHFWLVFFICIANLVNIDQYLNSRYDFCRYIHDASPSVFHYNLFVFFGNISMFLLFFSMFCD